MPDAYDTGNWTVKNQYSSDLADAQMGITRLKEGWVQDGVLHKPDGSTVPYHGALTNFKTNKPFGNILGPYQAFPKSTYDPKTGIYGNPTGVDPRYNPNQSQPATPAGPGTVPTGLGGTIDTVKNSTSNAGQSFAPLYGSLPNYGNLFNLMQQNLYSGPQGGNQQFQQPPNQSTYNYVGLPRYPSIQYQNQGGYYQ